MTVFVISNVARTNELIDSVGVQGVCSTKDKAHDFMGSLWAMRKETPLDYKYINEYTEEFITNKAIYTIEEVQVDYMIEE